MFSYSVRNSLMGFNSRSFTDLDMSAGLDKIFLPSWSTQVDGYGGYGGYSAEW